MKKVYSFSMIILVSLYLYACADYHPATSVSYKKLKPYPCKGKQKNVFLFYEGQAVGFKFKPLGNVRASGKAHDNEQEIIDRLKYTAFQNCANAIVNIKTEIVEKNYGGEYRTGSKTYECKIYSGMAVRIESDSLYRSNALGNSNDLSFMKNTIKYNQDRKKRSITTAGVAIAVSLILVGIYGITVYR